MRWTRCNVVGGGVTASLDVTNDTHIQRTLGLAVSWQTFGAGSISVPCDTNTATYGTSHGRRSGREAKSTRVWTSASYTKRRNRRSLAREGGKQARWWRGTPGFHHRSSPDSNSDISHVARDLAQRSLPSTTHETAGNVDGLCRSRKTGRFVQLDFRYGTSNLNQV